MIASQVYLTRKQINSFDRFLVEGTGKTLDMLESMFGLNIERSDSSIEIATAADSVQLKHLGRGILYMVSSDLQGDLQGRALLLMRSRDFRRFAEAMRPVLSLLFLSAGDDDLEALEGRKPGWMQGENDEADRDVEFQAQMMDTLTELGNVLIGLYTRSMFVISNLNSHHTVPHVSKDPARQAIQQLLPAATATGQPHVVIEHEFVVMERPFKLWCVISPTRESFQDLLRRIEIRPAVH